MKDCVNFQQKLDMFLEKIEQNKDEIPTLMLHSCCAPCSSYVLEYLSKYFQITIYYYNPNISDLEEYKKRVNEQEKFIKSVKWSNEVKFLEGEYYPEEFYKISKGLEHLPEGGERCYLCYMQRMRKTAIKAKDLGFDYFTTTLSISPYKNAKWLNNIGELLEKEVGIHYLFGDFKKKNGYKRSIELSKIHNLYRQEYCGCIYSKVEQENRSSK